MPTKLHILKSIRFFQVPVHYTLIFKTLKSAISLPQCIYKFMMVRLTLGSRQRSVANKVLATHHILPVLFTMTKPATLFFRAIANFIKFVTCMDMSTPTTVQSSSSSDRESRTSFTTFFAKSDSPPTVASETHTWQSVSPNERFSLGYRSATMTPQGPGEGLFKETFERMAGEPEVYDDITVSLKMRSKRSILTE